MGPIMSLWGKKSFSDEISKIYIDLPPSGIIGVYIKNMGGVNLDRFLSTHRPGIKDKNDGDHLSPTL